MATTRLMPIHAGTGKTISSTIRDTTLYIKNPDKTENGELVSSFECDPCTVDTEWLLAKEEYAVLTGREQGKSDVLAYHLRQSFRPGEITQEDANRIGYELAMAFTKGRHAFIVATHIDRAHIHNHIIFNSTALDCSSKFRNFWGSTHAVRRISDQLCVENGLSIVENPQPSRGSYGAWLGDGKAVSHREKLRQAIDAALAERPANIDVFLKAMKDRGYEAKAGKLLAFRLPEQQRYTRLRALGDTYSEQAIRDRIEGKSVVATDVQRDRQMPPSISPQPHLLIDIQNNIRIKGSPGYEHWAKVFNIKQAAQTLIFLQEHGLDSYAKLDVQAKDASVKMNGLAGQVRGMEMRLSEIAALQKHISTYSRTREVYAAYRQSGYSPKFYTQHETEIQQHKAAKVAFDATNLKRLPTIRELKSEYAQVFADKKKAYSKYQAAKRITRELLTAKANVDQLLRFPTTSPEKGTER